MNFKDKLNTDTAALAIGTTVFVLLLAALVVFGPLGILWSLNTVFPALAIPYTFWTWLAVVVFYVLSKSSVSVKK